MVDTSGSGVMQTAGATQKYRMLAELGRGGMATVYLAVVQGPGGFNKLHVIKRLRASLAEDPDFLKMFLEEARLSARINHPNVVQTYEVGFDGSHHYIAMEYLDGLSLEAIVRRAKKDGLELPLAHHLKVLVDILAGLHFAHELKDFSGHALNVVHRDVSPHNIIVTYDGHVKLVDFGIAKAADSSNDTRTGMLKGKCAYMAPEQFGGKVIDRRADVFAVGILLWQAITGQRMWHSLSDAEIFQRLASGQLVSPRSLDPSVPERLDAICMKALAIAPVDRFATAEEFQSELEDYLHTLPRVTSAQIGSNVAAMFADNRATLRRLIEEQLAAPASTSPIVVASNTSVTGTEAMGVASHQEPAPVPPSPTKRLPLVAVGVFAAMAVVGLALALHRRPPAATDLGSASTPGVLGDRKLTLKVTAKPAGANVFVDGELQQGNPPSGIFTRDGASHQLRVEAAGFVTKEEKLLFDSSNVDVDVTLEPATKTTSANIGAVDPKPKPPTPGARGPFAGPAISAPAPPGSVTSAVAPPKPEDDPWNGHRPQAKPTIDMKDDPWKQ